MATFSKNAIVKFSEKNTTNILDINLLFNISNESIYKTELYIDSENEADTTILVNSFLVSSNFRINSLSVFENISDTYIVDKALLPKYTIYTNNKDTDAIYILSMDTYDTTIYSDTSTGFNGNCNLYITVKIYNNSDDVEPKIYKIKVFFITEALNTMSFYTNQAHTIGSNMESFMLIRTNPKLTGNIKLVVDTDYNIYLDTLKVSSNSLLNERRYRHLSVSADGNYPHDIKQVFSTLPKGILFDVHSESYEPHRNYYDLYLQIETIYEYGAENNTDSLYSDSMKIFAPLYLGRHVPDYFCIFRTSNIINNETYSSLSFSDIDKFKEMLGSSETVKIYDLRRSTSIGQYLNNYRNKIEEYLAGSCYLLFIELEYNDKTDMTTYLKYHRLGINTWKGISIDKGILVSKTETTYFGTNILDDSDTPLEDYDMFILNGFYRNNILFPNIINLEFMFNDETAEDFSIYNYFGLYLTENEFLKFKYITKTINANAEITYYTKNNTISNRDINKYLEVIENTDYIDRLFFMSTNNNVANVYNINDINNFIKENICNKPDSNICNVKALNVTFNDIDGFITLYFSEQILYGEHFKFIILNHINSLYIKEHIVLEIIASNDIRLRYVNKYINPYISTNTVNPALYNIEPGILTNIYRITFYTLDLNDPTLLASLDEQLQRLLYAINRFNKYIYTGHVSDNSISIIAKYVNDYIQEPISNIQSVYFQHILADIRDINDDISTAISLKKYDYIRYYNINNKVYANALHYNTDAYSIDLLAFSNSGLELTGNRLYTAVPFIMIKDYDDIFYLLEYDIYDKIKNTYSPLLFTVKGYYPLNVFNILNMYIDYSDYVYNNRPSVSLLVDNESCIYDIYTIISPYDTNKVLILTPYKAILSNSYLSIYTPMSASLSLMGINAIKDINVYIDKSETINYKTLNTCIIKAGESLYFDNSDDRILLFVVYQILSGSIKNLPVGKGNNFMVIPGAIIYLFNGEVYETPTVNNCIIAEEDTELSIYNNTLNIYDYTVNKSILSLKNYFINPSNTINTNLKDPIVPLVNCQWKSNGLYFDHDSVLNINNFSQDYSYIGNFTETTYTLLKNNYNQYIINGISTPIKILNNTILIKDFIINDEKLYSYPLKKYIMQTYKPDTAIGYYNKYILQLEFIYYGIKFIIKFTNADYTHEIKLEDYNNYEIFIMNDYNASITNDIYISAKEQFILIINHSFDINALSINTNIINTDNLLSVTNYNWLNSPYNLDFLNTALLLDNIFGINKSNEYTINTDISDIKNINYFLESDIDVYDNDLAITNKDKPYFIYLKTDDSFKSYNTYDILNVTAGYFLLSDATNNYTEVSLLNTINGGDSPNNIMNIFEDEKINYRKKQSYLLKINSGIQTDISDKDVLLNYILSFKNNNINVYIINNKDKSKLINITDSYRPITLDISIPENIKYNNGLFNPDFIDIFEFNLNDNIADSIDMDCLLANTLVININRIPNYTYNKVMSNNTTCVYNYFITDERSILSTNWDNRIYRLYTDDTNYTLLPGYLIGINDKMFFGSKCLVLDNKYIEINNWTYDINNITLNITVSSYNENSNSINVVLVTINITKSFNNLLTHIDEITKNWLNNINNILQYTTSFNNFINNTLLNFYNINNTELLLYRKYDADKIDDTDNIKYELPDDFSEYTLYLNFLTDYQIVNNEIVLTIILSDYISYYYYPVLKIYKY